MIIKNHSTSTLVPFMSRSWRMRRFLASPSWWPLLLSASEKEELESLKVKMLGLTKDHSTQWRVCQFVPSWSILCCVADLASPIDCIGCSPSKHMANHPLWPWCRILASNIKEVPHLQSLQIEMKTSKHNLNNKI